MNNKAYKIPLITNIQRFCSDDGEGIRTTVFMKGCPLKCIWCHNPETQKYSKELMYHKNKCTGCGKCTEKCPSKARSISEGMVTVSRSTCLLCGKCEEVCPAQACEICGKEMSEDEITEIVKKDKIFYEDSGGGMTLSGGECSAFPQFSLSLIEKAKQNGIGTAIETCGYGDTEFFEKAANLSTAFLYDIKTLDSEKHKNLCGRDNALILKNLKTLMELKADITIRIPLIPDVNDSDNELKLLKDFLNEHKGKYKKFEIMPYHATGIHKSKALDRDYLELEKEKYQDSCAQYKEKWDYILNENER